jgi:hypothetical protein
MTECRKAVTWGILGNSGRSLAHTRRYLGKSCVFQQLTRLGQALRINDLKSQQRGELAPFLT